MRLFCVQFLFVSNNSPCVGVFFILLRLFLGLGRPRPYLSLYELLYFFVEWVSVFRVLFSRVGTDDLSRIVKISRFSMGN